MKSDNYQFGSYQLFKENILDFVHSDNDQLIVTYRLNQYSFTFPL